ncbi:MAG TPA: MFS transporter [Ilumatobacter sp.]|nr:MFS transporter [Ilumatobacter sp.]
MPASSGSARGLSGLVLSVYLPTIVFAIGQGAVIPVVALTADDLGAGAALASLVVAVRGLGMVAFGVPAGMLIERWGEQAAMLIGTGLIVVSLGGAMIGSDVVVFAGSQFLMGCGWAVWQLARLTYVTQVVAPDQRGRALSTLGGVNRIGTFIGPFVGAVVLLALGNPGAYLLHAALTVGSLAMMMMVVVAVPAVAQPVRSAAQVPFAMVLGAHARVFATAGVGALCLNALRASRSAVLPLWGARMGFDAAQVSLLYGISSAVDMTLFYPAGLMSDRIGRKAVAVPCMVLLAAGFLAVPLTSSFAGLAVAGTLMGLGNGLGSGIVMTLGADFAPREGRASFLGVWRVVSDLGTSAGPLAAGVVSGVLTLGAASVAVGGIGLVGAAVFCLAMPETLTRLPSGDPEPA